MAVAVAYIRSILHSKHKRVGKLDRHELETQRDNGSRMTNIATFKRACSKLYTVRYEYWYGYGYGYGNGNGYGNEHGMSAWALRPSADINEM